MFLSNYSVYRRDCNSRGGGVFILVHDSIVSQPVYIETESCETVWSKILLKNGVLVAKGSFYRPPGLRTPQPLFQLSNTLLNLQASYAILGGDFNLPDVEWQSTRPILCNTSLLYLAFPEIINAHSLSQLESVLAVQLWSIYSFAMPLPLYRLCSQFLVLAIMT